MKKKLTVDIGIAAFNEETNILNIIIAIQNQIQNNYILKNVIISSDGSTDKTEEIVKQIKDKRIRLIKNKVRSGKTESLKNIFKISESDILILFDADISIIDKHVIGKLITPFFTKKYVMLIGGNSRPLKPNNFFEKAVFGTFVVFDESRKHFKKGHNIFGCTGAILALKKQFVKEIRWKNVINDDDFLYFSCLKKGYEFWHQKNAVVYYKLPSGIKDYLKQVFRSDPHAVKLNLKNEFGSIIEEEYYRPTKFMLKAIFKAFIQNPIGVSFISITNLFCLPLFSFVSTKYKLNWFTANSTK